jgi:predicted metal-binding membrane protein
MAIIGWAVPSWSETRPLRVPRQLSVAAAVLGAALVAWIVTYRRMRGMDMGPGTDLGGLGWYVGIWVTMTAAMMLPSVAPTVGMFARVNESRRSRGGTAVFLAGYLVAWTAYGLAAYLVYRVATRLAPGFFAWDHAGRWIAAGALVLAGLYELTPLKHVCLRHCRSPLGFILRGWRDGRAGALRMGAEHGVQCIGCCSGLMLALFALGVMSVTWMVVVSIMIFAEKLLPAGHRLAAVFAVAIVAGGIWVAASPESFPGLHVPRAATPMAVLR